MILVLVAIFVLAWYTTPLPHWVDTGKNLWDSVIGWIGAAWDWVSTIGDAARNASATPRIPGSR